MKLKILMLLGLMHCFSIQSMLSGDAVRQKAPGASMSVNGAVINNVNDLKWDGNAGHGNGRFVTSGINNFFEALNAEKEAAEKLTGELKSRVEWNLIVDTLTAEKLFSHLIESGRVPRRVYVPKVAKELLLEKLKTTLNSVQQLSNYQMIEKNLNSVNKGFNEAVTGVLGTNEKLVDWYKKVNVAAKKVYKPNVAAPVKTGTTPPPLPQKPAVVKAVQNELHALAESLAVLHEKVK